MSNSRLEKFIYAICGMDVDDLPTPLSRIETLWNCLITGEVPDFKPLSRNEKYLMAMLNDNVDGLPEPTSRSEKLLYKIATGETDLSDVPGYLSRYEELLKQLIESGGIGGTDFEYVLYTLNQPLSTLYTTAEGPVKSAILSGNTLVNLSENLTTVTRSVNGWYRDEKLMNNIEKLKRNTYYTILYRLENLSGNHERYNGIGLGIGLTGFNKDLPGIVSTVDKNGGWCKIKFQLTDELIEQNPTYKQLYIRPIRRFEAPVEGESVDYIIRGFAILEGDYITNPIPFNKVFEGMQSVKMPVLTTTGKNIFSPTKMAINDGALYGYYKYKDDESVRCTLSISDKDTSVDISGIYFGMSKLGKNADGGVVWLISNGSVAYPEALAIAYNHNFISIYPNNTETLNKLTERFNIQLEHSEAKTTYEPFKTNILSCNEEVTLRGIGDVKDTLDGNTGELTQRIGEVTFDGSENWSKHSISTDEYFVGIIWSPMADVKGGSNTVSDKLTHKFSTNDDSVIYFSAQYPLITFHKDSLESMSIESFKKKLSELSPTVQYQLAQESVKTVVLSITDQDGQPTKLSTFNDITHVSIEAEDLLPTVDLEVPTKIEETLSTLPTLMNDISETQQSLNENIDDQAENINEVSTAIIEIRSDIL